MSYKVITQEGVTIVAETVDDVLKLVKALKAQEKTPRVKGKRGFASMDPKLASEISSKGGKAAHVVGTAHEFSSAEAREAGRKGGLSAGRRRKNP